MLKKNKSGKEIKLSLNFNLRSPNKREKTTIFAIIYNGIKQIKIPIGYKINPILWDNKRQMPKITSEINEDEIEIIKEITEKIVEVKFAFSKYFLYICTYHKIINENDIRELLTKCLTKNNNKMANNNVENVKREKKASKALFKALELYPNLNSRAKESTIKTYQYNLRAFKKYCEEISRDSIRMLSENEINNFEIHLRKNKSSENKIRNSLRIIRILINDVMCKHPYFKNYGIKKVNIDLPKDIKSVDLKVELNDEEIKAIEECKDLTPKQCEFKDLFLLQIYSGQRASDLHNLFDKDKHKIIDDYICFTSKKEGVRGKVKITKEVSEILGKYKDGFSYVDIKKEKLSMYITNAIKAIAEKSNLKRIIEYTDNKKQIKREPLYKVISSHYGRHTFITKKIREGIPIETLKYLTAHKDTQALTKYYIHLTEEDEINQIENCKKGNTTKINRNNINTNDELIKEAKEALYCLGASLDELIDINDLHTLNKMLYSEYDSKYQEMGCNMAYIKDLYLSKETTSLKEKRELIMKVVNEVKRKK